MWWPLFLAPSLESNPSKPLVLNKNNWDEVLRFVNLLKNHDKNISSSSKNLDFISEFDYFLYNFLMLARILNPANAPGSTGGGGGFLGDKIPLIYAALWEGGEVLFLLNFIVENSSE